MAIREEEDVDMSVIIFLRRIGSEKGELNIQHKTFPSSLSWYEYSSFSFSAVYWAVEHSYTDIEPFRALEKGKKEFMDALKCFSKKECVLITGTFSSTIYHYLVIEFWASRSL